MPPGELIDLSLSTDDDATPSRSFGLGKSDARKRPRDDDFLTLDDDSAGLDDNLWHTLSGTLDKKRRLSPGSSRPLPSELYQGLKDCGNQELGPSHQDSLADASDHSVVASSSRRTYAAFRKAKYSLQLCSSGTESDDSFTEDIPRVFKEKCNQGPCLSERTAALLARPDKPAKPRKIPLENKSKCKSAEDSVEVLRQVEEAETNLEKISATKARKRPKLTDEERAKAREERETLKAANKATKEDAKEKEQERKGRLREEKAKEKQIANALAEVNKSRLDKKDTAKEMIVDIPSSIDGQVLDIQIREFCRNLEIDVALYQAQLPSTIKWRRKIKSRYNQQKGYWEPVNTMEIEDEKHVLCLLSAQEFVDLASTDARQTNGLDVEGHVQRFKSKYPGSKPIYLIEGLYIWMRKNKSTLNRAYQAAVMSQFDHQRQDRQVSQNFNSRKKISAHGYVDEDSIEDALLRLQVMNNCLVHHTATTVETAEWVATFTQHISTIPSKSVKKPPHFQSPTVPSAFSLTRTFHPSRTARMNLDTSFCMESGQVKTGDNTLDTYVRMLQEVVRVTAPIAYGIAAEYPSVVALINGFKLHGQTALMDIAVRENLPLFPIPITPQPKNLLRRNSSSLPFLPLPSPHLPNLTPFPIPASQKSANKNGVRTEARIGPAISRRLYKVFLGMDPASMDI